MANAGSLQIDHGIGAVRPANKGCINTRVEATTIFTLSATGSDGRVEKRQVTVTVKEAELPKHARIINFSASETRITAGASVRLCYTTVDAEHTFLAPPRREVPPGTNCVDDSPTKSTTYVLNAVGGDNAPESRRVSVEVVADHPPPKHARIIRFNASDTQIKAGTPVRLCYAIADAEHATFDGREVQVGEDCINVAPKESTEYVLIAVGEDKEPVSRRVSVEVVADQPKHARIIRFDASDTQIKAGTPVRLCYAIADAEHTTLNGRDVPVENDCSEVTLRRSTEFVLTAVGEDKRPVSRTVSVEVSAESDNPQPAVRITRFVTKRAVLRGMQLCYTIENAVSASIDPEFGPLRKLTEDCRTLRATEPTTYTLTARGQDGKTDQKSVRYTPPEPVKETPIRIISFTPATQTINAGAPAKICYSTLGEGTAQISPAPGGVQPSILGIRRCVTVSPRESSVYTLTVTGPQGQQDSRRVTVTVKGPSILFR